MSITPVDGAEPMATMSAVSRSYGPVRALADVDFEMGAGEVVALLGPNGAGKTTLVSLLLGIIRPTVGRVRLFGGDPRDPENSARVGVMLQSSGVPDTLRVRELVDLFSSYYPRPLPLEETIGRAGLGGFEERLFGRLSGGQRQRLLFALAICGNPRLLFLDEPTVGLDVESRRAFWRQVREFTGEGRSVLLTTHYLEEADALADRAVVLDAGRVIAQGTKEEIKSRTAGARIRCVSRVEPGTVATWPGVTTARMIGESLEILATRAEPVVRRLLDEDPELGALEVGRAALEDAFLALTDVSGDRDEGMAA
ncbi:MAG TPA: ABC transporter ATP-binding protein [Trueperaceae bacterium]